MAYARRTGTKLILMATGVPAVVVGGKAILSNVMCIAQTITAQDYSRDRAINNVEDNVDERNEISILDFVQEFTYALQLRLEGDEVEKGDTWRHLPIEGYQDRIYDRFHSYYADWSHHGKAIPWLRVAGLALIAWVRENHPEVLVED